MGRMIVIEGLDGSGKTTQGNLLTQYLKGRGVSVRPLSFPNYGKQSCALVDMQHRCFMPQTGTSVIPQTGAEIICGRT